MNWDTIKLFLALYRDGSARAVAENHDLSPSTVTRRITDLETQLSVKLFNRLSSGFKLTEAGYDLLQVALRMESDAYEIERKLYAKKTVMQGKIRITIPFHFMTPPFLRAVKGFAELNPKVDLQIMPSWEAFKLDRGEADMALRLVLKDGDPPEDLIGVKLANIYSGIYGSKDYLQQVDLNNSEEASFVGWDDETQTPDWVTTSAFPHLRTRHWMNDPLMQVYATKIGLGLGMLPCFLCDDEPDMKRVPGTEIWHRFDVWLLSHPDLRETTRFRELRKYIRDYFDRTKGIWEGTPSAL